MSPEAVKAWQSIFRDVVITILAAFMLVYETVFVPQPNAYIIGAGLTLLGAPFAIRLDSWRRKADDASETADQTSLPHRDSQHRGDR